MKTWLKKYRKKGFDALKPKSRAGGGRPKRLDEEALKVIEVKCKAFEVDNVNDLWMCDFMHGPSIRYH
jgi:transposase